MESSQPIEEEEKENYQLSIVINKWQKSYDPNKKKEKILYEIDVSYQISKQKWTVYRSIEDIKNLVFNLSSVCVNLVECPNINKASENMPADLRNQILENFKVFLKEITVRGDVINNSYFIDFFELKTHSENLTKFLPELKMQIKDIKYEISDIVFLENTNILILATSKHAKTSSFQQNVVVKKIKFFFNKENRGEILIYKINEDFFDNTKLSGITIDSDKKYFSYVSSIQTENEISCMHLSDNKKYLIVGFFNGDIQIFETSDDPIMTSTNVLTNISTFKVSLETNRLINIGFNSATNYIYTACYNENEIGVSFINLKSKIKSFPASESDLCGFSYYYNPEKLNNLVITFDIKGRLCLGFIDQENRYINLYYVLLNQLTEISLFKVDHVNSKIFIGDYEGNFDVFSYEVSNHETMIDRKKYKLERVFSINLNGSNKNNILNNNITRMVIGKYPLAIMDVLYNSKKKELYIALHNGTIQVYSHYKTYAECVIFEDIKSVYKLLLNKTQNILFTGGASKEIFIYKLPEYYMSEMSRKIQSVNCLNILCENVGCRNAIDKGYQKNTKTFRKKSLSEQLIMNI